MSDPNQPPPPGTPQWGQQPPPPPPPQGGQPPPPPAPQAGQQQPPAGQWGQQQPQAGWTVQPQGSAGGLAPNVASMLAYLAFGWVGGLVMYLTQKDPEVRFHGAQSILLFGSITVAQIGLAILFSGFFGFGLSSLLSLFSFGMWVFMSIQGYNQNHLKLPVIGDIAEQWALKPV